MSLKEYFQNIELLFALALVASCDSGEWGINNFTDLNIFEVEFAILLQDSVLYFVS